LPDLSDSRAAAILADDPDLWNDPNVRRQFLKDWAGAPRDSGDDDDR
jgi:hypothetical protein